jgi:hypothetical protein
MYLKGTLELRARADLRTWMSSRKRDAVDVPPVRYGLEYFSDFRDPRPASIDPADELSAFGLMRDDELTRRTNTWPSDQGAGPFM